MNRAWLSLFFISLASSVASADPDGAFGIGTGRSGAYSSGAINSLFAVLASDISAGVTNQVTVVGNPGFAVGDLVMVWEPDGLSVNSGLGAPVAMGTEAGLRELARIEAISPDTLTLSITTSALASGVAFKHTFHALNHVQVLKVPEFTTVTVSGTVNATPWSSTTHTGGIIAFLANSSVTVNGTLSADGAGFRGGTTSIDNTSIPPTGTCNDDDVSSPLTGESQGRGEGVAGIADRTNNAVQGLGNVANGGGAGNCVQNGGGGGGNAGHGGSGGNGSDPSNHFPGIGGAPIDYSSISLSSQMTMGGGGGAGNQALGAATAGRAGGGVVWFRAASLSGTGKITANGDSSGTSGLQDGQGGGGGGGSIYIRVAGHAALCGTGTIAANGSPGFDAPVSPSPAPTGAGGGGGGGQLYIQSDSATCANTSFTGGAPGANGGAGKTSGAAGGFETAPATQYCSTDLATPACPALIPACDATSNSCVICTPGNAIGCLNPATPVCNASDTCVIGCTSKADCLHFGTEPICNNPGPSGTCGVCTSSAQCGIVTSTTPFCNASPPGDGSCQKCNGAGTVATTCTTLSGGADPICNTSTGACRTCTAGTTGNTECAAVDATHPICSGGLCVPCTTNAQCPAAAPICHPVGTGDGACHKCASNTECDTNFPALPVCNGSGVCVACGGTSDCNVNPLRPGCTAGGCVACDSAGGESVCTPLSLHCENNASNTHHGACVACRSATAVFSSDCSGDVTHALCDSASDTCVACNTNITNGETACGDNHAALPHCEPSLAGFAGSCVACRSTTSSTDCTSALTPLCAADVCTGCNGGAGQCTRFGTPDQPSTCNTITGHCVGCNVDSDCKQTTAPHCIGATMGDKSCGACADDTSCAHFSPDAGVMACQNEAVAANPGQCKQCSESNTTACTGDTPSCNFVSGECQLCTVDVDDLGAQSVGCAANPDGHACQGSGAVVFCGCTSDGDCGSATSGRICDPIKHLCADGCSRAPARNNCPPAQFCTSDDTTGTVPGVCTATCNFDVDCSASMPTMPFCINGSDDGGVPDAGPSDGGSHMGLSADGGMGRCAGCRTDSDCGGTLPVCEPSKKVCVQCTTSESSACTAAAMGSACLADETCGCTEDSQCGAADSGRICDLAKTQQCIPGCRVSGGNGCPSGLVCNGTVQTPGSCVAIPDMAMNVPDAGSDDMSVPIDMTPGSFRLKGGGFGCDVNHGDASTSWGALLLFGAAMVALRLRRRRMR